MNDHLALPVGFLALTVIMAGALIAGVEVLGWATLATITGAVWLWPNRDQITGWRRRRAFTAYDLEADRSSVHSIPHAETTRHLRTAGCPCHPTVHRDQGGVIVEHHTRSHP